MPLAPKYQSLIAQWKPEALRALSEGLREFFIHSQSVLNEFALRSHDPEQQEMFRKTQHRLAQQEHRICQRFLQTAGENIDHAPSDAETAKTSVLAEDRLSAMDEEQYERQLAIQSVNEHATSREYQTLYALGQRLTLLNEGMPVDIEMLPLTPAFLLNQFATTIEPAVFGVDALTLLLALFDKHLLGRLEEIHDQLNHILSNAGVLPHSKYHAQTRTPPEPANVTTTTDHRAAQHSPTLMHHAALLLQDRQRLSAGETAMNPRAVSQLELARAIDDTNQQALLEPLLQLFLDQSLAEQSKQQEVSQQIRPALRKQCEGIKQGIGRKRLGIEAENVIDLVNLLFEQVLQDPNLPEVCKVLLSLLHTPYLKFTLQEPGLMNDDAHPAWQLFDALIESSANWIDEQRPSQGIYPRMQAIVETLLAAIEPDVAFFNSLVDDLHRETEALQRHSQAVERRAVHTEQGRAHLDRARQLARRARDEIFAGQPISVSCHRFIQEIWMDYLVLVLLRANGNTQSESWQQAITQGRQLLAVVQRPDPAGITWLNENLRREISNLLPHQGAATESFLASLERDEELAIHMPPSPSIMETGDETDRQESGHPAVSEGLSGLSPGDRFLFRNDGQGQTRARLAWRNPYTDELLLVNPSGHKLAVMPWPLLADEMRSGNVTQLPEWRRGYISHALGTICKQLAEELE